MSHSRSSAGLADSVGEDLNALVELGVVDQDRGKKPNHGAAAGQREHAALLHRLDHGCHGLLEFDGQHQAATTDLADLGKAQSADAFLKAISGVLRPAAEPLVSKDAQGRGSGGADQRVAGKGAAVAALGETVTDGFGPSGGV